MILDGTTEKVMWFPAGDFEYFKMIQITRKNHLQTQNLSYKQDGASIKLLNNKDTKF